MSVQRRLAAILCADVVGYSRLMGEDEAGTLAALKRHRRDLIDPEIEKHDGRLVKLMGDGALVEFTSVVQATECAVAIQRAMAQRNAETPADRRIEFRIGLNLGDIIIEGDDIYGDGVNVAARLEGLAEPGGICISESVRTAVGTKLPLAYAFLGEREVKNIAEPVRAYQVVLGSEAPVGDVDTPPPCPFPGMVPYRAEDARFFYGRDDEIKRIVQLLRRQRFLMVIGPSGSGKSSLVYAGLLPELDTSKYFDDGFWLVRQMRPGPRPIETLAHLLDVAGENPQFAFDTVQTLLGSHPPAQRLLLLVDQFEETFTQANRDQRGRFIAALQGLRTPENCALILTLRADFYPDLMTSYLWPVDASQRVEVAPLRGEALRTALQQPAADVGVRLEDSLVSRLLADASDEPGALPLLQETMGLLWREMEHRVLPYHAYEKLSSDWPGGANEAPISGLAVAIAMKADTTLAALAPAEQAIARRIFLRLIQFGEGRADTRRQQAMLALRAAGDEPGAFERTLEHLTDHRLLTRSGSDASDGPFVDIAHEALITGWARLQAWADERREAEQIRRRLEGKAAEWVRLGRGSGGLLDDAELPEAERWLTSPDAADLGFDEALSVFVQASQQAIEAAERAKEAARQREVAQERALAEQQTRAAERMRRALVGLAAVLLVAVAAGLFAWTQSQKAQTLAAQEAVAREDAEARRVEAQTAREDAEARRVEAENARLTSIAQILLMQAPQQQAALLDESGALAARQAYLFSTAGTQYLKTQVDSVLRTVVGKPYFSPILRRQNTPAVAFSRDGTKLASTHTDPNQVLLWDLKQPGALPVVLPGYPGHVMVPGTSIPVGRLVGLAISSDGKTLIAANVDGSIGRWDLDNPQAPFEALPTKKGGVRSAEFSPDGRWLAMGSKFDDTFTVWDLSRADAGPLLVTDPEPAKAGSGPPMATEGGVAVAFSQDSATLATGSLNGIVRLWRLDDLKTPIASLRGHQSSILALTFYDNGRRLASSGQDATIRLWNLEEQSAVPFVLNNGSSPATSLDFENTTNILASGSPGDGIRFWQVDTPEVPPVVIPGGYIFKVAFSPDGKRLASGGSTTNHLRLWDMEPSGRSLVLTGHQATVYAFAFSPDMKLLASGGGTGDGTIRLWNWDDLGAPPTVLYGHEGTVNSLTFSGDGKRLLSASWNDNSVRLWDLDQSPPTFMTLPMPGSIEPWTARFSPDGTIVAATGIGGVYAWDLADPDANATVLLPSDVWATGLAFSPSGNALAMGHFDPDVFLKDLTRPDRPASALRGHGEGGTWSVAFSPDGRILASGGRDGTVRIWDPGAADASSIVVGRHDEAVNRVRFSPDGKQLASGSSDYSVRLWDIENPDALPTVLSGHEGGVHALAYSSDGKHLVTGSRDRTIRIWDLTHPLIASTTKEVADRVCQKIWRNLTLVEWHKFVGEDLPYERTCPNLPVHPSLIETAEKRAKAGDVEAAVALYQRAVELDPTLQLDPKTEAERLANSGGQ